MLLNRNEFNRQLDRRSLKIALVGMSNSGKSTCTGVLSRELGFAYFEVDEAINRELGIRDMAQAAAWMGFPFEAGYESNKQRYLELEARFSRVTIPEDRNFVLDTTGSIIYGSTDLHDWMRRNFLVVGLKVSSDLIQTLIDDYFVHPKTVVWGNEFLPRENEDGIEAMKRCYPTLLENRARLYSNLADIEISATVTRTPHLTAQQLLDFIECELPVETE